MWNTDGAPKTWTRIFLATKDLNKNRYFYSYKALKNKPGSYFYNYFRHFKLWPAI